MFPTVASGGYELTWSTITGGGGQSSNGSYTLIGAVGSFSMLISSPNPYAPTPNPMEWATIPYATRSSSISMMAANANDPTGGVLAEFAPGRRRSVPNAYESSPAYSAQMAAGVIGSTGGGQPHNNIQPYLGLNFIIALTGVYPSRS